MAINVIANVITLAASIVDSKCLTRYNTLSRNFYNLFGSLRLWWFSSETTLRRRK